MTALAEAWATSPGLWPFLWLLLAAFLGGLIRGFTGFGTALLYMPMAAMVLPPVWAVIALFTFDVIGPTPLLPRAVREGEPGDVARLLLGAAIALPLGLIVLFLLPPEPFRYAVSVLAVLSAVLIMSGVRYRGPMRPPLLVATGGAGGFLASAAGLPGPPVILLYLASDRPPMVIRANLIIYLISVDALMLALFAVTGRLELAPVLIGVALAPAIALGALLGARLFHPRRERVYRLAAVLTILTASVISLPVWGT